MINNKDKDISFWKILFRITPMDFAACPGYFIISNIIGILHGTSHGIKTLMNQKFFDYATLIVSNNNLFEKVILMAIILGLAFTMTSILNGIDKFMINNKENIIIGYIEQKVNKKAGKFEQKFMSL